MGKTISSSFALGWDSLGQTHNAIRTKQVILGDAYGRLMHGGDKTTRRFASTVLDTMRFCEQGSLRSPFSLGGFDYSLVGSPSGEINHLHRKLKKEIYSKHLSKPFMSNDELTEYILKETLKQHPGLYELMFARTCKM